jgi:hypothetical protein
MFCTIQFNYRGLGRCCTTGVAAPQPTCDSGMLPSRSKPLPVLVFPHPMSFSFRPHPRFKREYHLYIFFSAFCTLYRGDFKDMSEGGQLYPRRSPRRGAGVMQTSAPAKDLKAILSQRILQGRVPRPYASDGAGTLVCPCLPLS